jgi:hypothetical protein
LGHSHHEYSVILIFLHLPNKYFVPSVHLISNFVQSGLNFYTIYH